MEHINIIPSINDDTAIMHKPSFIDKIFWNYGYIQVFDLPIARKNKVTGMVEVRRYNETFSYWGWMQANEKYKSDFIIKKYW